MEKYGDTLFTLDADEEVRLGLLCRIFDPETTRLLAELGTRPDARCLEVGAGSGSIARWWCEQVPDGEVVATDVQTSLLERDPRPNLTVLRHDVVREVFPPESFDVIHARLVLSHLRERDEVLRRMRDWLRPGGVVLVESFGWFPLGGSPNPVYSEVLRRWSDLLREVVGTDSGWSRRQPGSLLELGYRDVGARSATWHLRGGTDLTEFWRRGVAMSAERLLTDGRVSADELAEFHRLLRDPGFWDLSPAFVQAWGHR
ncbi:class I SAM-dependent methyltransferase [Saccharopolyspora sp. 6V]|uniref:class I SAM-dependent methyltransferase n=1 Tax=Saccharopolyspora sp. 6V TaxID=2877239 RepID=UPI001CD3D454|nr:class I SAM-dependent methyltransferase [Saccharopolyspora sp. 6V]MCA1190917.1 methyltransferase [Saccharopolyspora sp. 6V]